jgi:hypothetical protein
LRALRRRRYFLAVSRFVEGLEAFLPEAPLPKATHPLSHALALLLLPGAAIAFWPAQSFAQAAWPTYDNTRFQYSICYPPQSLVPQPEAENGDGRHFQSKDGAELTVYGDNDTTKETPEAAADEIGTRLGPPPDGKVTHQVVHNTWFLVSGRTMKQIFFAKGYLDHDQFKVFEFTFPIAKAATYDDVAAKLEGCFKSTAK